MVIGIDFDNTLVNTVETSKMFLDEYKPNNNLKSYHQLPYNEEVDFFRKYVYKITDALKLHPNAKKALDLLKNNNIRIILITARGIEGNLLIGPTNDFLEKNNIIFDKKIYSAPKKGKYCEEYGIDLFIDDNDLVLEDIAKRGIKVLKFGSKSSIHPYVLNWDEAIEYFKKEGICE